eukprot:jgi/Mesvir1/24328/Mv11010-RA.1
MSDVDIFNCIADSKEHVSVDGGAVSCDPGLASIILDMQDVVFMNVTSANGALNVGTAGCQVTCTNCKFTNNVATNKGGAVNVAGGAFTCYACEFISNYAAAGGGAIQISSGMSNRLYYPAFSNNACGPGAAGPDINIEGLSSSCNYCPALPAPNTAGSQPASASLTCSTPSSPSSPCLPRTPPPMLPLPPPPGPPPSSALTVSLLNCPRAGQVPLGQPFSLRADVGVTGSSPDGDVIINLSFPPTGGNGPSTDPDDSSSNAMDSCSSYQLEAAIPSEGSCGAQDNATCAVTCRLGRLAVGSFAFVDLSLRPLVPGVPLVMAAARVVDDGTVAVQVPLAVGREGCAETIVAVDARQPIIAPDPGVAKWVTPHLGGRKTSLLVASRSPLGFAVVGPALTSCDAALAMDTSGTGEVQDVVAGTYATGSALLSFKVVPKSNVISLHVVDGACMDHNQVPSLASDVLLMLVDVTRPTVTVAGLSGVRTHEATASFSIQFSEPVDGFSLAGILVEKGIAISLLPSNASRMAYELVVAPDVDDFCFVTVQEGAAWDVVGHTNIASNTARIEHYTDRPALVRTLSSMLGTALAMSAVASVVSQGRGIGGVTHFVGHMQFFQFLGAMDVPLDASLRQIAHGTRWINNGLPWPSWGENDEEEPLTAGDRQASADLSGAATRWDVPASPQAPGGTLADGLVGSQVLGPARRLQQAAVDLQGGGTSLEELHQLAQEMWPDLEPIQPVNVGDELADLRSWSDCVGVIIYTACELAICLLLHAVLHALWPRMQRSYPGRWPRMPSFLMFPHQEICLAMLTVPAIARACAFYATSGYHLAILVACCVMAVYPLAFLAFAFYFVTVRVLKRKEVGVLAEDPVLPDKKPHTLAGRVTEVCAIAQIKSHLAGDKAMGNDELSRGEPSKQSMSTGPIQSKETWADVEKDVSNKCGLQVGDIKGGASAEVDSPHGGHVSLMAYAPSLDSGADSNEYIEGKSPPATLPESSRSPLISDSPAAVLVSSKAGPFWNRMQEDLAPLSRQPVPHDSGCQVGRFRVNLGQLRACYVLVTICKQLCFAFLVGIRPQAAPNIGWYQVCFFTGWLLLHVCYLSIVQPYASRVAHAVELVSLLCEFGSITCGLVLLAAHAERKKSLRAILTTLIMVLIAVSALVELAAMCYDLFRKACRVRLFGTKMAHRAREWVRRCWNPCFAGRADWLPSSPCDSVPSDGTTDHASDDAFATVVRQRWTIQQTPWLSATSLRTADLVDMADDTMGLQGQAVTRTTMSGATLVEEERLALLQAVTSIRAMIDASSKDNTSISNNHNVSNSSNRVSNSSSNHDLTNIEPSCGFPASCSATETSVDRHSEAAFTSSSADEDTALITPRQQGRDVPEEPSPWGTPRTSASLDPGLGLDSWYLAEIELSGQARQGALPLLAPPVEPWVAVTAGEEEVACCKDEEERGQREVVSADRRRWEVVGESGVTNAAPAARVATGIREEGQQRPTDQGSANEKELAIAASKAPDLAVIFRSGDGDWQLGDDSAPVPLPPPKPPSVFDAIMATPSIVEARSAMEPSVRALQSTRRLDPEATTAAVIAAKRKPPSSTVPKLLPRVRALYEAALERARRRAAGGLDEPVAVQGQDGAGGGSMRADRSRAPSGPTRTARRTTRGSVSGETREVLLVSSASTMEAIGAGRLESPLRRSLSFSAADSGPRQSALCKCA